MTDTTPARPLRSGLDHQASRVGSPYEGTAALPETVLQFGTGALLRGLVEDVVDAANRAGREAGRVVMVSSTGSGRAARLAEQDGLYTLCLRGLHGGERVDEARLVNAVSRALPARDRWPEVLEVARAPELRLVVSNTTEVGLALDDADRLDDEPPRSFPAKLTAALHARALAFDYAPERGLVVLPCELVEHNGALLRRLVLTLADRWGLDERFARWVREHNRFCDTLVDRIVPGRPDGDQRAALTERLGYTDALLTVAEPFLLWAVEGDHALRARLPFAGAHEGVVVVPDIAPFRRRKVRILNGTHTALVPAALLAGCTTVREAVTDEQVGPFARRLALDEIVPSLELDADEARRFAHEVLERFANPFIHHQLRDIAFQQTSKMPVRVLPSLRAYVERRGTLPPALTLAFAAFLLFQHEAHRPDGDLPPDDAREGWQAQWRGVAPDDPDQVRPFVAAVCADADRWGEPLDALPGFTEAVAGHVVRIARHGIRAALPG